MNNKEKIIFIITLLNAIIVMPIFPLVEERIGYILTFLIFLTEFSLVIHCAKSLLKKNSS